MTRRISKCPLLVSAILLVIAILWASSSWAAESTNYPTKPINLLIGYAPGGVIDITARFMAAKAERILGQPFAITNNGAAGSSAAWAILKSKPADGYNIVAGGNSALCRMPHLRELPYKMDDFIPIMHYATPILTPVVVKADSPWKTFKDLVDYAKKNPGKLTYSTTGAGSPMHISMEYVAKQEGIKWTHVPYPGTVPAFTAMLGGHVNFQVGAAECIPYVKNGTVRILANLSEKRVKTWPDVPTLVEQGYDTYNESVFMFGAPKGTPKAIIDKLDATFRKAMDDPEFPAVMAKVEFEASYRNSEDTRKYLEKADKVIGAMIRELMIPKEEEQKK
jgi:tripartite-type tricarboxylate transporter receptor subunit TctC